MNYYHPNYAYAPKFDPERRFATADAARAFDRSYAGEFLGRRHSGDYAKAMDAGDDELKAVLRFVADEIDVVVKDQVA